MAFENLSERLQNTIAKLTGKGKVSESDVKEMMREVRLALLEADVNFKVVKEFVKKISERAVGTEVMKSLTPAQQIVKIVNEELVELLGGTNVELNQGGKIPKRNSGSEEAGYFQYIYLHLKKSERRTNAGGGGNCRQPEQDQSGCYRWRSKLRKSTYYPPRSIQVHRNGKRFVPRYRK